MSRAWDVYIAANKDRRLVVGITPDPDLLYSLISNGEDPKTAKIGARFIVYRRAYASRAEAATARGKIVRMSRKRRQAFVTKCNPDWMNLGPGPQMAFAGLSPAAVALNSLCESHDEDDEGIGGVGARLRDPIVPRTPGFEQEWPKFWDEPDPGEPGLVGSR